jgi:sigma-B regulation protein RsbU (phosphoserine phosphatase)
MRVEHDGADVDYGCASCDEAGSWCMQVDIGRTGVATPGRVAAVHASGLMTTGPEEAFNRLTRLASMMLDTPMVALTIVDDVRSFLKGAPNPELLCGPDGIFQQPVADTACQVVINSGGLVCAPDVSLDPRLRDLPQIHQFGAAAWIGVPVLDPDGRVLGNFCAMDKVVREWTPSDIEALDTLALAAGGEVALRLALSAAEHHADEAQELAEILQESLIPAQAPRVPGVQFGVRFRSGGTGGEVMGDFYDVIPARGGFGVVIGDVCGKGAGAARTTALGRSAVRTAAHSEPNPATVLHTLNEVLHIWFGARRSFLTATYATFTRDSTGAWGVCVASGGHPPGFVHRADGSVEQLDGGGRVLGITADCPIHTQRVSLAPGDSITFYTDGISEARSHGHGQQFEESGVIDVLAGVMPDADADTIAASVADAAYAYADHYAADDSGVVVIRIVEP